MDLTRAEAVNEIVRAKTDRARGLALQRLSGAIEEKIRAARDALVDLRASLEAMIDAADDEPGDLVDEQRLDDATALLEGLTRSYRRGRIFQEGVTVAIAGATNAGKSSLFNLLLRQERAIVSEVHGTTRDWLEGMVGLEGIPVRLLDTAGLRPSADPLEIEGMRRTDQVIHGADAVMYLVDGVRGLAAGDEAFLSGWTGPAPLLKTWNKIDSAEAHPAPAGFIPVSAATGEGIDGLVRGIVGAVLGGTAADTGEPLIDSERQRDLIERALGALSRFRQARAGGVTPDLLAVDVAESLDALGELTGEVTSAEILERVFSRFCVGK
jgi:tRNA modification GTPase